VFVRAAARFRGNLVLSFSEERFLASLGMTIGIALQQLLKEWHGKT
jgi:hypothetical protein